MNFLQSSSDYSLNWTAPSSLTESKTFSAIFYALEPALQMLGKNANKGAIFLRWAELTGTELDLLAIGWDLHNYDPAWTVEKKKEVLHGCLFEKAHLGTVFAVKQAIKIISNATFLEEWFQQTPPGREGTFRLITDWEKLDIELTPKKIRELISYVNYSKAARCLWTWNIRAKAENELKIIGPFGHCEIFSRLNKKDSETIGKNELKINQPLVSNTVFARI